MRTRKLAELGKKNPGSLPQVVMRGDGHWLAGTAVTSGSVTDLLCDLRQGASLLQASFSSVFVI